MGRVNDVFDAVDFILTAAVRLPPEAELITHLKLQKLLYYLQGYHLAFRDEPLFGDEIEAWEHGPVVRSVWVEFRDFGRAPISAPRHFNEHAFTSQQVDLLERVYRQYGLYSAWGLREMTHREPPWKNAWEQGKTTVIRRSEMRDFFKTKIQVIPRR